MQYMQYHLEINIAINFTSFLWGVN